MTTNHCYTHNKPNCKSQYCDVASGKCIKKTKAGRPYKTKLETDLGSSYYYDEKYGLVGTKESVKTYIKELSKTSKVTEKVSKKSRKDEESRSSEKVKKPKKSQSVEESESVEKSRSVEKVKKPKKTSPPKLAKNKEIISSSPSSKSMKEIQKRISDIMSGEDDISMDSFLKSNPILTKTKSKKTKKAKKDSRVARTTKKSVKPSTVTKSSTLANISQKRLKGYRVAIGLVEGECYG